MPATSAARAASKGPAWLGNRAASVSWAAWAARLQGSAAGGVDVGVVGLERPVDGDDRVVNRGLRDRQGAGRHHGGDPRLPDGVQRQLIPFEDDVRRQQAAVLQQLDAGQTRLAESHGEISFGLRYDGNDNASGAQTGRRGGAGPAGACLAVRTPPGHFAWSQYLPAPPSTRTYRRRHRRRSRRGSRRSG